MNKSNTNFPWVIVEARGKIKHLLSDGDTYITRAEDVSIADADGVEVVGCSEWIRGEENFERIILCVNASAQFTDEELKKFKLLLAEKS